MVCLNNFDVDLRYYRLGVLLRFSYSFGCSKVVVLVLTCHIARV